MENYNVKLGKFKIEVDKFAKDQKNEVLTAVNGLIKDYENYVSEFNKLTKIDEAQKILVERLKRDNETLRSLLKAVSGYVKDKDAILSEKLNKVL